MNIYGNLKTDNFTQIFNNIHAEVKQKMQQESQAEEAKEMEIILKEIKHTANLMRQKTSSNTVNYINNQLVNLINETFSQQVSSHSSLKNASALFHRSHNTASIKGYDDIFEEQLNFLLQAAANMKGLNVTVPFGTGQERATSTALNALTKEMEENILTITKEAATNMKVSINAQEKLIGQSIIATSGKIDLKTPYFNVTGDASNIITKLLQVFSNRTFTLKNYSTYTSKIRSLDEIDIHLGNTNPYKAITGGLSEISFDEASQNDIYYRGMTILSGISQNPDTATPETINAHFAHLRFMYELRGSGLYTNGQAAQADFLIWNDPASENIIVRSTKDLIARYIDNYTNAFSAISISASIL